VNAVRDLEVVLDGFTFLESPRWHGDRIWVSDFHTQRVVSAAADGSDQRVEAEVPGDPSGLGWLPDGRLLVVSMQQRKVLRREADGELVTHGDVSAYATGPANDMVVDGRGRAYVGNFGFGLGEPGPVRSTVLVRVDPDGSVSVVADDLHFPNGSVIIGNELVVAETMGNRLSVFTIRDDGSLGPRTDWARFGELNTSHRLRERAAAAVVGPDGICADAEGAIWVADCYGRRVVRVRRGGEIVEERSTGERGSYACGLGGDDGRTLFICTAGDMGEDRIAHQRAQLVATRVDVPAA
jgi:sugar lactone lactonase YvrE